MEHRLVTGGEQFLPFARSCITKLKKLGMAYANQSYEVDGVSIKVRIEPGHEYIRLDGGGGAVSVFSNAQYPEILDSTVKVPGESTRYIGSYPANDALTGGDVYAIPYVNIPIKTRFGTSPFSDLYLKLTQRHIERGPVYELPYTLEHDVVRNGVVLEQIRLATTTARQTGTANNPKSILFTDFIPSIVSCDRAVISMVDADLVFVMLDEFAAYTVGYLSMTSFTDEFQDPPPDPNYWTWSVGDGSWIYTGTDITVRSRGSKTTGHSSIRIRTLKKTDGNAVYDSVEVATTSSEDSLLVWETHASASVTGTVTRTLRNRIRPYTVSDIYAADPRRWHALERVSVSPNGMTFVLRETNEVSLSLPFVQGGASSSEYSQYCHYVADPVADRFYETGFIPAGEAWTADTTSRGYTLSIITPEGLAMNHVLTGDLGEFGYIDGIFTSADGKHCYVYYGLHDASEADVSYPTKYFEYMDKIAITKGESGGYTFAKTTIALGPISHTISGLPDKSYPLDYRTTHYASKLHGASVEVGGFLWADRFAYNVKANEFFAIPDYAEHTIVNDVVFANRDWVTGANADRAAYISVSASGKKADYYLTRPGAILSYSYAVTDGVGAVTLTGSLPIPAAPLTIYEDRAGYTFRFPRTRQ